MRLVRAKVQNSSGEALPSISTTTTDPPDLVTLRHSAVPNPGIGQCFHAQEEYTESNDEYANGSASARAGKGGCDKPPCRWKRRTCDEEGSIPTTEKPAAPSFLAICPPPQPTSR